MCKESETKKEETVNIPDYVRDASQSLVAKGMTLADKPFQAYTDPRVADFTTDQQTAFQKLRDTVSGSPIVLPEALQGARDYASAPAQSVGTERTVDENGWLGSIADYINPNTEAALTPALRKISEAAQAQRLQSNAAATMSGAFGDARHGVVESGINKNQDLAVGDTSSQFFQQAFDKAMAARSSDAARKLSTDTANAGYNETALQREFAGTGALEDRANSDQQRQLQLIQAQLAGGTAQQANTQANLDANFAEFMRKNGYDLSTIQALSAALKGAALPYDKTTVETKPDNSGLQLAGSVAAQAIPAILTGGASLPFTAAAAAPSVVGSASGSAGLRL